MSTDATISAARRAAAAEAVIIMRRLCAEYYEADEADTWMHSPHPQLEGRTPVDLIAEGRGAEVAEVLDRLDADAYL